MTCHQLVFLAFHLKHETSNKKKQIQVENKDRANSLKDFPFNNGLLAEICLPAESV